MSSQSNNSYWNRETIAYFLKLMKLAISDGDVKEILAGEKSGIVDWNELFDAAVENEVVPMLYKKVEQIYSNSSCISEETFLKWQQEAKGNMFFELPKYTAIRKVIDAANQKNIRAVFFKGIILADLYPQYLQRISSDSDIFIEKSDIKKFEQLLTELGYEKIEASSKEEVQVYKNKQYRHVIEAHTCLWEDYKGPRMQILDSLNLTDRSKQVNIKACDIDVWTFGHEEHLIYQIFHIVKHFSLNGIGVKYLSDITLFVNRYISEINVKDFWEKIDKLGYGKFTDYFFYICQKYLGMTSLINADREPEIGPNVLGFVIDLISVGNISEREAGWQIMGAMEAYFTGEESVPDSKLRRKLNMLFPSAKALPKVYKYAKKYPILLPFAWIHRDIKFLIRKAKQKNEVYDVTEKIDVAENRMYLIKKLGLTDK